MSRRDSGAEAPVCLRRASLDDTRLVWKWRNETAAREASFDTREIPWAEHQAWFARRLCDSTYTILIAEVDGRPLAQARLEMVGPTVRVHVIVAPGCRDRGIGSAVLGEVTRWCGKRDHAWLVAEVRVHNRRSVAAFERAGFSEIARFRDAVVLAKSGRL